MTEEASPKPRLNLQDCRSQDLVSRLLAATPPYLYSAPTGPHSFFFSEMLRSLVQAKTNNEAAAMRNSMQQQQQQQHHQQQQQTPVQHQNVLRRPRKRQWSQHRTPIFDPSKKVVDVEEKEKPLELTKKHSAFTSPKQFTPDETIKHASPSPEVNPPKYQRLDDEPKPEQPIIRPSSPTISTSGESANTPTSTISSPNRTGSEIALPPPPPMWYPPLYPPYGIDPLHFFIDLRVSGHIYDRKKECQSPTYRPDNNNTNLQIDSEKLLKCRQNSAFSVPTPKDQSAMNLTSHAPPSFLPKFENDFDYFDSKENKNSKNTNYVMQNLPRIYTNLTSSQATVTGGNDESIHRRSNEEDNEKIERKFFTQHNEKVVEPALIGYNNNNSNHHHGVNKSENGKGYKVEDGVGVVSDDDEPITIEEID